MTARSAESKDVRTGTRNKPSSELVEVVDENDRPVCVMPASEVHRQALRHRSVLVLLFDKEKIYLKKRDNSKKLYPGRLDLSVAGHVLVGESREAAALRKMREELGVAARGLKQLRNVPAGPDTDFEFVTLFMAPRTTPEIIRQTESDHDGMFVDSMELERLVESYRDRLTPGLVHFWKAGLLFRNKES